MDEAIAGAAEVLLESDALLVTAGAGMGVDSGLPDFRGNEGFWNAYPPYRKLGKGFVEMANPEGFRSDPSFAWGFYGHLLEDGTDLRTIQELLGHEDVCGFRAPARRPPSGSRSAGCLGAPAAPLGSTTEIYLHVAVGTNGLNTQSPLDGLAVGSGSFEIVGSAVPSNVVEFAAV